MAGAAPYAQNNSPRTHCAGPLASGPVFRELCPQNIHKLSIAFQLAVVVAEQTRRAGFVDAACQERQIPSTSDIARQVGYHMHLVPAGRMATAVQPLTGRCFCFHCGLPSWSRSITMALHAYLRTMEACGAPAQLLDAPARP